MTRPPDTTTATLRRLLSLARDLLQAPDPHSVLELTGPAIQELLLADSALLLLKLGEQEHITEFDRNGTMIQVRKNTVLYHQTRQAIDDQKPILLPIPPGDLARASAGSGIPGTLSLLAIPFPPIKPVGALAVVWHHKERPHQLTEPIKILRHISELTTAALGNVGYRQMIEGQIAARTAEIITSGREHQKELLRRDHVEEELHRISVTDVMTGMLNRRGFFLNAERSLKIARRRDTPAAMIYADLDELKSVNDELGHDTGDRLIQNVGQILQASFRDSDVVARMGGDEFAAFTLDAEHPDLILARIYSNITSFRRCQSLPYKISLCIGIVRCNLSSDLSLADYISMADKQMYEKKKSRSKP